MQVRRPQLKWWEKLYVQQILQGLGLTFRHIFQPKFTRQYPEEKPKLYGDYRGAPVLVRDPEGRVKCVSCQLCEFVCPPKAIRITPTVRPEGAPDANVEKEPQDFVIDMLRCIYCGYCEEVCPEEAIFMSKQFEFAPTSRAEMIMNKEKLLEMGGQRQDEIEKWAHK